MSEAKNYKCKRSKCGLNIACLNIRGLSEAKANQLEVICKESDIDILAINETHLKSVDSDVNIPGYTFYRNDRQNGKGGGTAMYVRSSLPVFHRNDIDTQTDVESCWLEVKSRENIIIGTIYRPPSENLNYYRNMLDLLEGISTEGKDIIILGDLNFDCLDKTCNQIAGIESLFDMKQIVSDVTRQALTMNNQTKQLNLTETLIDIILTTVPNRHSKTRVEKITLSDHYMILTHYSYGPIFHHHNTVQYRSYNRFNKQDFMDDIMNSEIMQQIQTLTDVENAWEFFKNEFQHICGKHAPLKTSRLRVRSNPWMSKQILEKMYLRDHVHKKAWETKDESLLNQYKSLKNQVTSLIRSSKKQYFEVELLQEKTANDVWKILRKVLPTKFSNISYNPKLSANSFCQYYSNIGHEIAKKFDSSSSFPWRGPDSIYQFKLEPVDAQFVSKIIRNIPSKSSLDVLNFDSKLLKEADIAETLTFLFNLSITSGIVPGDWKLARVSPIYKGSGCKSDMGSYRPISNTCHIVKLMEKCVHFQLMNYLNEHNFITDDQSAYLKQHSTTTSLHRVTEDWLEAINDGNVIAACFLDIKKCFDTIDHTILLNKLTKYGVLNGELQWFKSYLANRTIKVKYNNETSRPMQQTIGIPQGSVLGPILFIIFTNDLSSHTNGAPLNMFADDALLYTIGKSKEIVQSSLQNSVDSVEEWYDGNKQTLNTEKSQAMLIRNRQQNETISITINDVTLRNVNSSPYLGVIMDNTLSFKEHITKISNGVKPKLVALRKLSKILPKSSLITIYKTMIQPVIDYACTLWGNSSIEAKQTAQRLQNTAARIVTGNFDYINTHGIDLVKTLGWQMFEQRLDYNYSMLMFKAIHGEAPNYLTNQIIMECDVHDYSLRNNITMNTYMPQPKCEKYKQSLMYAGGMVWNNLDDNLRDISRFDNFKLNYKKLYFK